MTYDVVAIFEERICIPPMNQHLTAAHPLIKYRAITVLFLNFTPASEICAHHHQFTKESSHCLAFNDTNQCFRGIDGYRTAVITT